MGRGMSTNDSARAIRTLLSEFGLQIDPQYAGEVRRLFDNPGYRMRYQRASGLTVDRLGEMLWSRGITPRRLDCREVLDLLDTVLRPGTKRDSDSSRAAMTAEEHAIEVRRKTRLRLYTCANPDCGKRIRVADDHLDASHNHVDPDDGSLRVFPFVLQTPILQQSTPF
jgi:hypothetical protein